MPHTAGMSQSDSEMIEAAITAKLVLRRQRRQRQVNTPPAPGIAACLPASRAPPRAPSFRPEP